MCYSGICYGFSLGGTTWSFADSPFDSASATWHESTVGNTSYILEQALGKPVSTWPKRSLMCSQVEWALLPACSRVLSFSWQHFSNVYFGNRIPAFLLKLYAWWECTGSMNNVLFGLTIHGEYCNTLFNFLDLCYVIGPFQLRRSTTFLKSWQCSNSTWVREFNISPLFPYHLNYMRV